MLVTAYTEQNKNKPKSRPAWDIYFMQIAHLVATRSTCLRRSVGAVIIKDKRILATGYNGAPSGMAHCEEVGCVRNNVPSGQRQELCRALHAEQNAILQAALYGVPIGGATLYCTNHPCVMCAKMIVNAGMKEVVIDQDYPDELAAKILAEAGVAVRFVHVEKDVAHG